ncbi:MAG: hypothetical protein IKU04_08830, partial [Bacteroidales bacterium]|nr:hypothetical protein [Bacteroidales bacterium]
EEHAYAALVVRQQPVVLHPLDCGRGASEEGCERRYAVDPALRRQRSRNILRTMPRRWRHIIIRRFR